MDPTQIPEFAPPGWSLLVGEIGRNAVLISTLLFGISLLSWILAPLNENLKKIGKWSLILGCVSILASIVSLGILFANNRFEFEYVYGHADIKNALGYRIAGIWSGQEGSFLLWACCSAIFVLLVAGFTKQYQRWFSIASAFFLGGITSILVFESPFKLNMLEGKPFAPVDGLGLAPSLQNYWVIIHPPTIFLGFGSLTVLFALAVGALVEKDFTDWIKIVRPWAIVSLTLLGLGLCMGGFWAYETLGWGGFWMWDPVENVSFVPWCFLIAFVHGIIVQSARGSWKMANIFLGGFPFLVYVYGTFLTRSGMLSDASVHSFAEMNQYALWLLVGLMGVTILGFFGLMIWRMVTAKAELVPSHEQVKGLHREQLYSFGVWALSLMGIATMIGMSVPLIMALRGQKAAVVPESLYHQILPYIFIPLMVLMAVTPFASWKKTDGKQFWNKLYSVLCISIGVTGLLLFAAVATGYGKQMNLQPQMTLFFKPNQNGLIWMLLLTCLCIFTFVANIWKAGELFKKSKLGTSGFLAHLGVCILMIGLVVSRGFELKNNTVVMENHPAKVLGYEVKYQGMTSNESDRDNKLKLAFYDSTKGDNKVLFTAEPGLYKVNMGGQEQTMVWPHIQRGILNDVYVSLGPPQYNSSEEQNVKLGKSIMFGDMKVTYMEMTKEGQAGQAGTKFGAIVKVEAKGKSLTLNPKMALGNGQVDQFPVAIDKSLNIAITGMNAADKSVNLQVQMTTPLYPVEVYHKPLVLFVWLGTAILTIAGFMAAFYRKPQKVTAEKGVEVPGDSALAHDLAFKPQ